MHDFPLLNGTFTVVTRAEFEAGIWRKDQPPHVLIVGQDVDLARVRPDYLEGLMRTSLANHQRFVQGGGTYPVYTVSVIEPKGPAARSAYYGPPS